MEILKAFYILLLIALWVWILVYIIYRIYLLCVRRTLDQQVTARLLGVWKAFPLFFWKPRYQLTVSYSYNHTQYIVTLQDYSDYPNSKDIQVWINSKDPRYCCEARGFFARNQKAEDPCENS